MAEETGFAGYGYTDSGGEKISALIDMINGGGAGRAGQEFEGGGILSLIANLLASPYGSRARGQQSPDMAMRPPARPAGAAPAPAPASTPALRGPAGGPPPASATAPALRGPAGGPAPRTSAPALPTGGPGTFAPGSMPAAMRSLMPTGGSAPVLPTDPASRAPIGMATIPRIPRGGFLPPEVRNIPSGPDNLGPMARVEGPTLSELLMQSTPPRDPALVASELVPPMSGGRPEMADTPSVPSTRAPAVGDFAARGPADVARGVAPRPRPRARPMAFESFVESLGPAAEGVSPEVLREAYRRFLENYTAN